jgi:hypothetical protein
MLRKFKKPQRRRRRRRCVLDHTNETLLRNQGSKQTGFAILRGDAPKKLFQLPKIFKIIR